MNYADSPNAPEAPDANVSAANAADAANTVQANQANQTSQANQVADAAQKLATIQQALNTVLIGQSAIVEQVLIGLVADAHVLLEGVPGLGKTLLSKALGKAISGEFRRIQFTPDLMPSDVIGHSFFDASANHFVTRRGPVFAHLLLADEINRAPAKTQSALLEAMQEKQVTLDGETLPLPRPFMVLATQNPIELEGTYPLPEAQLDRFLLKIRIDYPNAAEELQLTRQVTCNKTGADLDVAQVPTLLDTAGVLALQATAANLTVDDRILEYAVALVRATRQAPGLSMGAGPRGAIALVRASRAMALLHGHDFVTPDDVKAVALPCLRHRVAPAAGAEIEGLTTDDVLLGLFEHIAAPRT